MILDNELTMMQHSMNKLVTIITLVSSSIVTSGAVAILQGI